MALDQKDGQLRQQVAEEVRALMARRRISGVQLAKQIGRSQAYIWRRLSGETPFDVDDLQALAAVLDVSVTDLFGAVPATPVVAGGVWTNRDLCTQRRPFSAISTCVYARARNSHWTARQELESRSVCAA